MKRGILILGLFLVSVLAVFEVVAPEYVDMGFDNINTGAGTLDVVVNASLNVYGFQFVLKGATITGDSATAGDIVADWDVVDNNGNSVFGLDFDQDYFDEDSTLLSLGFSNYIGPICFDLGSDSNNDGWEDYNILSDDMGGPLCACWSDVCIGTYCECSCLKGDTNGDGGWNVLDVVVLVNCILNIPLCGDDVATACSGDTNGDGGHNVLDVVVLVNCILGNNCGGIS